MLVIIRFFILIVVLAIFEIGLPSCNKQPSVDLSSLTAPNFPFTVITESGSIVFIAPEYFNQKNLHDFFLWRYRDGLRKRSAPTVKIFTERELLNAYLEERKTPWRGVDTPREFRKPAPPPPPALMKSRKTYFDAEFSIVPSESSIDPNKGDDISSRGYNVTYSFAPDLNQPHIRKEVVLRGATWRQGKYNIETQEFPWQAGTIKLTAYDIYNVEPSGRYHTFTVPRKIGDYETTSIVFNILLKEAVPLTTNRVKIFNDQIAYVYLGWIYSVTLDGGRSWHLWDAERNLPEWNCCDADLIKDISISEQGDGVMIILPDSRKPESLLYLRTRDFGQHWKKDQ